MRSILFFPLLMVVYFSSSAVVSGMSVQVYNDSTCAPSSLNLDWSFTWPTLGPAGSRKYVECAINPLTEVPISVSPPSVAFVAQTLAYWCSTDGSGTKSDLLAYLYNSSSVDCDEPIPWQRAQLMMNSFSEGQCGSISVLNYLKGQYVPNQYAVVNCSTQTQPSNSASSAHVSLPMLAALISISIGLGMSA